MQFAYVPIYTNILSISDLASALALGGYAYKKLAYTQYVWEVDLQLVAFYPSALALGGYASALRS